MKKLGTIFALLAVLGIVGEVWHLRMPTVGGFFDISRSIGWLHVSADARLSGWLQVVGMVPEGEVFPWFGWFTVLVFALSGGYLIYKGLSGFSWSPMAARRIQRFRSIRRGYISYLIILFLVVLGALDHVLVGNRALLVRYDGQTYFPAFQRQIFDGSFFGRGGDAAEAEVNYRQLRELWREDGSGNWLLMPPIPYAPTGDSVMSPAEPLEIRDDGLLYERGEAAPFSGQAERFYEGVERPLHLRQRFRNGVPDGPGDGRTIGGERVYSAEYEEGERVDQRFSGGGSVEEFLAASDGQWHLNHYHPAPPLPSQGHLLGTTPQGSDVIAYLYGGLQVNIKACLIFIPVVYFIGVSIGLVMGFFGGAFDITIQRLIEILENLPVLFLIIMLSEVVPTHLKGLPVILAILIAFGWMGMTYTMRAAALRERTRDYVAAARLTGASTLRIVYRHILPNSVAILVTLIPFSAATLVFMLTALDYLGFGLPPTYASWGRLLQDGITNLSKPWLVTSAFTALVCLLTLVTFVGEAVREAFDPKKFTIYE